MQIIGKFGLVEVQKLAASQDGVLESKPAVAFLRKVGAGCLSLLLMPFLWLICPICNRANLSGRADVSCNVRRYAILRASATLRA